MAKPLINIAFALILALVVAAIVKTAVTTIGAASDVIGCTLQSQTTNCSIK